MSEKMFGTRVDDVDSTIINITRDGEDFAWFLSDDITDKQVEKVVDKLNEQESTITSLKERNKQLRRRLEKINGGYGHLTHRNGLTANEWVIERQEKELRKKNEQISDWIERHSKDIVKIGEQQATISQLKEENEQLKQEVFVYKKAFQEQVQRCSL